MKGLRGQGEIAVIFFFVNLLEDAVTPHLRSVIGVCALLDEFFFEASVKIGLNARPLLFPLVILGAFRDSSFVDETIETIGPSVEFWPNDVPEISSGASFSQRGLSHQTAASRIFGVVHGPSHGSRVLELASAGLGEGSLGIGAAGGAAA